MLSSTAAAIAPIKPMLDGVVAMRAMAAAAPEFSGGDSDLIMQVSGTIEVIYPQGAQ